ncbi:MAG: rRNA maturation RNase YbeY [Lachnospiraceae bacterium]|nr:rRNA maturation RNase YbeY [Lachnospiraceae bacterium]
MTITLTFETDDPFGFDAEALIRQVAEAAVEKEACPYACAVDVLILDNDAMREINREERGIDAPTDVLSFPAVPFDVPGDFSHLEDDPMLFEPDSGELLLGDMVISADKVLSQAEEYGHSPRRELAFLTAHSMYHLMGYDHETEPERLIMEEKQESLLQELGITRDDG